MALFDHVMVDLETLSTQPTAAIVSIAGVAFNMQNDKTADFYVNINPKSAQEYNMRIDVDTVDWWRKQNPDAVRSWMKNGIAVVDAAIQFNEFLMKYTVPKDVCVWANGVDFDLPIIRNLMTATDQPVLWNYWNQMDARTIFKLAGINTRTAERIGNYHNALDDCHNQIRWVKQASK